MTLPHNRLPKNHIRSIIGSILKVQPIPIALRIQPSRVFQASIPVTTIKLPAQLIHTRVQLLAIHPPRLPHIKIRRLEPHRANRVARQRAQQPIATAVRRRHGTSILGREPNPQKVVMMSPSLPQFPLLFHEKLTEPHAELVLSVMISTGLSRVTNSPLTSWAAWVTPA